MRINSFKAGPEAEAAVKAGLEAKATVKVSPEAEATVKGCPGIFKVKDGSWELELENTKECLDELKRQKKLPPTTRKYTSKRIHLRQAE